jgi:hypothetical protein
MGQDQTRRHGLPVEQHSAGPTVTFIAAFLGASEMKLVSHHIKQGAVGFNQDGSFHSVDRELYYLLHHAVLSRLPEMAVEMPTCPINQKAVWIANLRWSS